MFFSLRYLLQINESENNLTITYSVQNTFDKQGHVVFVTSTNA